MKNPNDPKDENPFRYIILYNELKENKGNEIDYFLYIKDKKERKNQVELILKNNLLNYFKMIKYNYKDEYKKIVDENKKEIGYIVRSNLDSGFENYFEKWKTQQFTNATNAQNLPGSKNLLNAHNNVGPQNAFNPNNSQNLQNNLNLLNNQQVALNATKTILTTIPRILVLIIVLFLSIYFLLITDSL